MQYFKYKSEGAIQEMFLTIGKVILDTIVQKLVRANYIGILCDNVTDVTVTESLLTLFSLSIQILINCKQILYLLRMSLRNLIQLMPKLYSQFCVTSWNRLVYL